MALKRDYWLLVETAVFALLGLVVAEIYPLNIPSFIGGFIIGVLFGVVLIFTVAWARQ